MNGNQILGIHETERGIKRIEVSVKRIIIWALVFTNMFSVSYFFVKLFKWV
jgi:hypothetical protein